MQALHCIQYKNTTLHPYGNSFISGICILQLDIVFRFKYFPNLYTCTRSISFASIQIKAWTFHIAILCKAKSFQCVPLYNVQIAEWLFMYQGCFSLQPDFTSTTLYQEAMWWTEVRFDKMLSLPHQILSTVVCILKQY